MRDKKDRLSGHLEFIKFMKALCLKEYVSDGKRFIHNQNFRINVDGNRKCKPHEHSAGIHLDRLIYIFADIRKGQNVIELGLDLILSKADHCAVQIDILNAVVLHVEAGSQFQER